MDLANSALPILCMVLLGECVTVLLAVRLDPDIGVPHADHERRPSVALDLFEELLPMAVDQVVLLKAARA